MSEMFVVAHISDLHFNGSEHHRSRVELVLHYINSRAEASTRCSSPRPRRPWDGSRIRRGVRDDS